MNLTISNDTDEIAAGNPSSIQAVALTTQGDQGVFQNVRLLGNQDTLQVKTSAVTVAARMYFKNSYIEGDTDFIFGRATAVFDGCTLFYVSGRKTNSTHISPSTEMPLGFGFLIINSKIMGATGHLGDDLARTRVGRQLGDDAQRTGHHPRDPDRRSHQRHRAVGGRRHVQPGVRRQHEPPLRVQEHRRRRRAQEPT